MSKGNGKKKFENVDLRTLPKDKRPKPSSGQSAPERELPYESLSDDEKEVIKLLDGPGHGHRQVRSIEWLADGFDGDNPKLRVRNALRRPVSCGWVDWVARGQYQISEKGRKRYARA